MQNIISTYHLKEKLYGLGPSKYDHLKVHENKIA